MTADREQDALVFDRAAGFYDRTRWLRPETIQRMTALLSAELAGGGTYLEIGVGTGRIALPLAGTRLQIVGLDLSEPMLRRLVANAGGSPPFPLVLGDARRLPFGTDRFGGGLVAYVFHLIPDWQRAARELFRVIQPGGVALINIGTWERGLWKAVQERFAAELGIPYRHRGVNGWDELDEELEPLGIHGRDLEPLTEIKTGTYRELIASLESGTWSFTWDASPEELATAGARVRPWIEATYGPVDSRYEHPYTIEWRSYTVP